MAEPFLDPIDGIETWDGKRLRVMIVWEVETTVLELRRSNDHIIPSLEMIEGAMAIITRIQSGQVEQEQEQGTEVLIFPGPKEPQ